MADTPILVENPSPARRRYFAEAQRIYLREVRPSDVNDNYYRWMNDPDITEFLESRFFPNSVESLCGYVASKAGDHNNVFLAIVLKNADRHIGNIKMGPIDWVHRSAEIGIIIGEKDCWGQGLATESIAALCGYAFDTLNLHRLTAGCYHGNHGSLRAFEKAGFTVEGTRKSQFFSRGRYVDHVLFGKVNPRQVGNP